MKNKLSILLSVLGSDKVNQELAGINTSFGSLNQSCKSLTGSFIKGHLAVQGLIQSFRGLKNLTGSFIELSNEEEKSMAGLRQALISNGRYSAEFESRLHGVANALQKTTIFGNESILSGQKFLATYKDIGNSVMPRASKTMADIAALMGGDMVQAANMLGKASMGMIGELRRVGITVDQDTYKTKGFLGILEQIEEQVGGQAEALRKTGYGGMEAMGNALGDVKERIGDIIKAALGEKFEEWAKDASAFADRLKERLPELTAKVKAWFEGIFSVGRALAYMFNVIKDNSHVIKGLFTGAIAFAGLKLGLMLSQVGNLSWAIKNLGFVIRYHAATALTALASNPVTLAIAGISALIGLFVTFKEKADAAKESTDDYRLSLLGLSEDSLKKEETRIQEQLEGLRDKFGQIWVKTFSGEDKLVGYAKVLSPTEERELKEVEEKLGAVKGRLAEIAKLKKDLASPGGDEAGLPKPDEDIAKAWEKIRESVQFKVDSAGWSELEKEVGLVTLKYEELFEKFKDPAKQKLLEEALGVDVAAILKAHKTVAKSVISTWEEVAGELSEKGGLKIRLAELTGGDVAAEIEAQLGTLVEAIAQADPMSAGYARLLELEENYIEKLKEIREKAAEEIRAIDAKSFSNQMVAFTGYLSQKTAALANSSRAFFEIHKVAAVSEGILSLKATILDAYAAGTKVGGPPLGAIFATIAGGAQVANLAAIAVAKYGDTARPTALGQGGGTGTSPVVTQPQPAAAGAGDGVAPATYHIHVYGTVTSEDELARTLIPKLEKARQDGVH